MSEDQTTKEQITDQGISEEITLDKVAEVYEKSGTYWNHRVMRKTYEDGSVHDGIHEVYYDKETNEVKNWTDVPTEIVDEVNEETGRSELMWVITKIVECTNKPILDHETGKPIKINGIPIILSSSVTVTRKD